MTNSGSIPPERHEICLRARKSHREQALAGREIFGRAEQS